MSRSLINATLRTLLGSPHTLATTAYKTEKHPRNIHIAANENTQEHRTQQIKTIHNFKIILTRIQLGF
jgi:hypothetical protein